MVLHYLTVAYRSLRTRKLYTVINVTGLAIGLACCFLIVLFIQHERSFDSHHEKADRIYRVLRLSDEARQATTPIGLATDLEAQIPEVERLVRFDYLNGRSWRVRIEGDYHTLEHVSMADPAVFDVFDVPLIHGTPASALSDVNALVLSESGARQLFGTTDAVGRTVERNGVDLTVTAVMADAPATSLFQFNALRSAEAYQERFEDGLQDYSNTNFSTFALLRPGADPAVVEEKLVDWAEARFDEESSYRAGLPLQPLTSIHLDPTVEFERFPTRDPRYLWVFGAVALLIVLIAAINFTNLATAKAAQRGREVGVRKAIGALRGQLIGQFFGESLLLAGVAIALALLLVVTLAPAFSQFVGADIVAGATDVGMLGLLVGVGLIAGLIAGAYPALYLSGFNPTRVLKGESERGERTWLRKGLIVFQFSATVALIVATLTISDQLRYMQSADLGFNQTQVVSIPRGPLGSQYEAFRQQLIESASVEAVALSTPPGRLSTHRGYQWPGADASDNGENTVGEAMWSIFAGPGYLDLLDLDLLAGRDFTSIADTQNAYIVNEAAVAAMGVEDPVGYTFHAWDRESGRIIGVVRDFHFKSLHHAIEPVVIHYKPEWVSNVSIRLAPGAASDGLAHARQTWAAFADVPFEYRFLDEDFGRAYADEELLMRRFGVFGMVAILIACLGLFGLAAYVTERRRKEIGVRKVLGASVGNLVTLINRDFSRLILIAIVISAPLAYWGLSRWLSGFAYQAGFSLASFGIAALVTLAIAVATVSFHAVSAATADPIRALRSD